MPTRSTWHTRAHMRTRAQARTHARTHAHTHTPSLTQSNHPTNRHPLPLSSPPPLFPCASPAITATTNRQPRATLHLPNLTRMQFPCSVKIQQLLAGEADEQHSEDSDGTVGGEGRECSVTHKAETLADYSGHCSADSLTFSYAEDAAGDAATLTFSRPGEALGADEAEGRDSISRGSNAGGARPSSCRPTSSQDVTPTHTPLESKPLSLHVGQALIGQPYPPSRSPDHQHAESLQPHGRSPMRPGGGGGGRVSSRISSRPDAPPVLRHLRMPENAALADAAAEILQL